ncbi:MAG: response regulator [Deltaproteobacteria bacterium]|nr:response regulator [Deltaproteobacteria bacterium]
MPSILVVDDDAAYTAALRELFDSVGLEAVVANDGREGLRLLRDGLQPTVIVLDLDMPSLSGVSFRFGQLGEARVADIPVIVCSGISQGADTARLLGAAEFLRKPIHAAQLIRIVRRLIGERHGSSPAG